jgi:hypothetical protein
VCRTTNHYPVPLGGLISVAHDAPQAADTATFTTETMADAEVLSQFDRSNATDGFRVEYTIAATGKDATALWPAESADPEDVTLDGCSDAAVALNAAKGLWARQQYRRQYLTWTTELAGHLVAIGARVRVEHPLVGTSSWIIQQAESLDEHRVRLTAWRYDERQYV